MKWFYPNCIWEIPTDKKVIYLTFDDGPMPAVTHFVLETLSDFNAKATFFCIGDNIQKHPTIFKKVLNAGHAVGNHTFNHLSGWKTNTLDYQKNIELCQNQIELTTQTNMFRPPYGRIKLSQIKHLKKDYKIVMWSVLTGDFSSDLSPEIILEKSIKNTKKGSIVVFHDSIKASNNLEFVLPRYLKHFADLGYAFEKLPYFQ